MAGTLQITIIIPCDADDTASKLAVITQKLGTLEPNAKIRALHTEVVQT